MRKKKNNLFLKILSILFVIFMGLYIANSTGYYEAKIRDKVVATDEGIKEFEERIKSGEEIDLSSFMKDEKTDYSSRLSNLGDALTNDIELVVSTIGNAINVIVKSLF